MEANIVVILFKIIFMELDYINGMMEDALQVIGEITKCMEQDILLGLMEESKIFIFYIELKLFNFDNLKIIVKVILKETI